MQTMLKEIIKNKIKEVAEKKQKRDFVKAIINPKVGDVSIIAEIKLTSPSAGRLASEDMITRQVKDYEIGGADAISVVVDRKYFGGKLEFLRQIKSVISFPILAKDFILDPYQVYEAKYYGTDAILLIAKILSKKQLKEFVNLAFELGLEPVVEVQNRKELEHAVNTKTRIIAVNARDLTTFEVDIGKACKLIKTIPKKFVSLGFSGVSGRSIVEKYKSAGAKGVLVGTSLIRTQNVEQLLKELKGL